MTANKNSSMVVESMVAQQRVFPTMLRLTVYFCLALYVLFRVATGLPAVGSWWQFVLIFLLAPFFHHLTLLLYTLSGKPVRLRRYFLLIRLATLAPAVVMASVLFTYASGHALHSYALEREKLIGELTASKGRACGTAVKMQHEGRAQGMTDLWQQGSSFVVAFYGGSIDIDGSTIFYRSQDKSWIIVHNDSADHPGERYRREMRACNLRQ